MNGKVTPEEQQHMYGMMHRMAQASQDRGNTTSTVSTSQDLAADAKRYQAALEQISNSPFIKGYEAIAIARDALGIKPK